MLTKLRKLSKQTEGFTIIEVLIVLAIAGLILLIVFLAVPALQRNSRNTNRRTDVSKALGALQESINNNGGTAPTGGTTPDALKNVGYGYYDTAGADIDYNGTPVTALPTTIDYAKITIRFGLKCTSTIPASSSPPASGLVGITSGGGGNLTTQTGATSRTAVALYTTEVGGGKYQPVCVES